MQDESANGSAEAAVESAEEAVAEKPAPDPLEEAKAEAAKYKDQLLRTAADFDNFRKRTRKDASDAEKKGREEILKDLLPVFDNLERAVSHAEKATDVQSVAEGIKLVVKQFTDTLGKLGIERVQTVGVPFDPSVHEAIQHLESADYPPGTVAVEIQPGYRSPERLLRPALVVVAKAPASS